MSLKKNTAYNIVGATVPTLLALATIPIYLQTLGAERFGALSAIWVICGLIGILFDIGLNRGLSYTVAKAAAEDPSRPPRLVATALLISSLSSTAAGAVTYAFSWWYFSASFTAGPLIIGEARKALPLIALISATHTLQWVIAGALQGNRNFLHLNVFMTAMTTALHVGPLVCLLPSMQSITALLAAVLALRVMGLVFGLMAISRKLTSRALIDARTSELRPLLTFSRWTMGISVATPVILFSDKLLVGSLVGAPALALYNIYSQFAQRISLIPSATGSAILPELVASSTEERSKLLTRAVSYVFLIVTLPSLVSILVFPDILGWWIGEVPKLDLRVAFGLLILAFWINCIGQIYHICLVAMNHPATVFYILCAEVILYVLPLYFLIKWVGIIGAALSMVWICLFDAIAMYKLAGLKNGDLKIYLADFVLLLAAIFIAWIASESTVLRMAFVLLGALVIISLRWQLISASLHRLRRPAA